MQFKLATSFEASATEIIFHLIFSGKKNKFQKLLFKKMLLFYFLGIDSVSDKLERGLVQVQFFKAKA